MPLRAGADRLALRPWCSQDIQDLINIYRDPVMSGSARNPIVTEQDAHRWLEMQQEGWAGGGASPFFTARRRARPIAWLATSC